MVGGNMIDLCPVCRRPVLKYMPCYVDYDICLDTDVITVYYIHPECADEYMAKIGVCST